MLETFANPSSRVSMLMSEDFPTFERPMKANSGSAESGQAAKSGALE